MSWSARGDNSADLEIGMLKLFQLPLKVSLTPSKLTLIFEKRGHSYGAFFRSKSDKEDIVGRCAQVVVDFRHRFSSEFFGQRRLPLGVLVQADGHERDVTVRLFNSFG